MSDWVVLIKSESTDGDEERWKLGCNRLTVRQVASIAEIQNISDAQAAGRLPDLMTTAFGWVRRDDEDVDPQDLPIDLMEEALDRHPSFRESS